ncbi:MAG: amidohydrolase [Bryobacteraceae bacterium]
MFVSAAPGFQNPADLVLYNGKVWTVDPMRPQAQAVAVSGSKLVRVGTNSEVLALKGAATRVIDLQGKTVLPGFNDAHTHFENATQWFFEVRLIDVDDPAELLKRLREAVQRVPKGMWITATDWSAFAAWDAEKKSKGPFHPHQPDLAAVDAVAPDHPVLFRRYDHNYFANSRALKLARVTENTPDPKGGRYEKDPATGKLTGMLIGRAGEQMEQMLPPVSMAEKLIGARGVMKELNRYGITSIHDIARLDAISQARVFPSNIERSYSDVNIFRSLKAGGDLSVRVYAFMPLAVWPDLAKNGIRPGSGDEMIRYGILKDFADASLMFEPFANNPKFSGSRTFRFVDEETEQREIVAADKAGFDIGIHVIGDKALHILLNWYEAAMAKNGPRDRRFRLIHVEYAREEDLKRAGRMHLIADVTPYHLMSEPDSIERTIGPERAKMAFAWRTMIDSGVKLDIVSDLPGLFNKQDVGPFNPLQNIYYAITRKNLSGYPPNGWHPEQCMTMQEAIQAYTLNPAFASHEENLKGSITEGKLADLVVLSKDILSVKPAELMSTEVVYTILGGKIVWQRQ